MAARALMALEPRGTKRPYLPSERDPPTVPTGQRWPIKEGHHNQSTNQQTDKTDPTNPIWTHDTLRPMNMPANERATI